jgi:hypothetical protein
MIIRSLLTLISFTPIFCYAQTPTKGKVLDDGLKPVIASVLNKATNSQVYTDRNGNFEIESSIGDTLKFLSIGLTPEYRVVRDSANKVNVILINKEVNCLGAIWDQRDYKRAYRLVDRRYKKLYIAASKQNVW